VAASDPETEVEPSTRRFDGGAPRFYRAELQRYFLREHPRVQWRDVREARDHARRPPLRTRPQFGQVATARRRDPHTPRLCRRRTTSAARPNRSSREL